MELNDYANKAMAFRLKTADPTYAVLNLGGEVGEIHSLIAKAKRDGPKPDFFDSMKKEIGDVLWHVAAVALDNGFSLDEIARYNLEKLGSRKERGVLTGSGDNR